jgi:acyl-CoA thioester hydrolase
MSGGDSDTPYSGAFRGGEHRFALRVYFEDTDAAGIVYYANYLKFIERARSDMLRAMGVDQRAALDGGEGVYVVPKAHIKYHRPARLDDDLVVVTTVEAVRGASVTIHQRVRRERKCWPMRQLWRRSCLWRASQAAAPGLGRFVQAACEEGIGSVSLVSAGAAADRMSPVTLFIEADIVVKGVMVGLLLASIWTWSIIVAQWWKMRRIARENERFERDFWKADDIDRFYDTRGKESLPPPRCLPPAFRSGGGRPRARRSIAKGPGRGSRWR